MSDATAKEDADHRDTVNRRANSVQTTYALLRLMADFLAAVLFLIGSVLFLYPALELAAIWLFIVGSAFFLMKPLFRLMSYRHLTSIAREAKVELEALAPHRRPF